MSPEELVEDRRLGEERRPPVVDLHGDGAGDEDDQEAAGEGQHVRVGLGHLGPVLGQPGAQRVAQVHREEQGHQGDGQPEETPEGPLDVPDDEEARDEERDQDVEEVESFDELDDVHAPSASGLPDGGPSLRRAASPCGRGSLYAPAYHRRNRRWRAAAPVRDAPPAHRDGHQARSRPPWWVATASTSRATSSSTSPSPSGRSPVRISRRQARLLSSAASGAPR